MLSPYNPGTEYSHWDSGLWTRVMAASGVHNPFTGAPFTEAMLSGLAGGIGFMIFTFEYKDTTTASAVTRFHPGPYTENLVRRSGAAINIQQTGSASLAQSRLDAALESGVPAVVRVVRGKLPWAAEDPVADMESVDVAVVSRDGEDYLMDDGGGRLERISPAALAQARGSRKADKHWQGHVVTRGGDPVSGEELGAGTVRQAMAETVRELLSQQSPPGIPPGYANNFGILGMQTWAQRLTDGKSKHGWLRIFADPERARIGMDMLHGLLAGKRFSGPGALRPLYARFLAEAALIGEGFSGVQRAGLQEAAAQYRALGEHWDALTGLVGAAAEPDFVAMASRVEAIAELESHAAKTLEAALATQ
ncbi:BtrH N-terminal domain-containing protein [Arthrobacter sp. LAPM80]|uniref:BtrH N-terminal domain-containing protein n=1 Tax=Arthrobacter sp. LAPM80 TaxID=3141788 RepID=UPI00398B0546